MTVILFIIVLSVLVFVHELGHFLAAKWAKMRVDEFAIGFPPRIWGKKKGETVYAINALPIGGYVKIHGENPNDETLHGSDAARSFTARPKYQQIIVLAAGVTCNVIFAWFAIALGFMIGFPLSTSYLEHAEYRDVRVVITAVSPDSPAQKAGIAVGDYIDGVLVKDVQLLDTPDTIEAVQTTIASLADAPVQFEINRGGEATTTTVVPVQTVDENGNTTARIGVALDTVGIVQLGPIQAVYEGAKLTIAMTEAIAGGLYTFVADAFRGEQVMSQVAGPVGIAKMVGGASSMGFAYLLSFTALISINLAIINILPFPALDGGRIVFVIIEAIIRRPIPYVWVNAVNAIGFILLLTLMAVVTVFDILKLF